MSDAPERVALDILYDASVDYDQLPISVAGRCYAVLDAMIAENARLQDIVTILAVGKERNAKPSPAPGDDR